MYTLLVTTKIYLSQPRIKLQCNKEQGKKKCEKLNLSFYTFSCTFIENLLNLHHVGIVCQLPSSSPVVIADLCQFDLSLIYDNQFHCPQQSWELIFWLSCLLPSMNTSQPLKKLSDIEAENERKKPRFV